MNPSTQSQLRDLYAEWHRLTDLEGEAIREGDWGRVDEQQTCKQALQPRIADLARACRQDLAREGRPDSDFEAEFRPAVMELVNLEVRNREELCRRRDALQADRRTMGQSVNRLRGLRQSYRTDAPSTWQSWS